MRYFKIFYRKRESTLDGNRLYEYEQRQFEEINNKEFYISSNPKNERFRRKKMSKSPAKGNIYENDRYILF